MTLLFWLETVTHVSLYHCFRIVDFHTCYFSLQGPFLYIIVKLNNKTHRVFSLNFARIISLEVLKITSVFM